MLSESLTAIFSEVAISYVLFILAFCFVFILVPSWDPDVSFAVFIAPCCM